jgi:hypothetical protein
MVVMNTPYESRAKRRQYTGNAQPA